MKKFFVILVFVFNCCGTPQSPVPNHYYELTKESPNSYESVPFNTLKVQYIDNYASNVNVTMSLYNAETLSIVSPSSSIGTRNINGLNKLDIDLTNYPLVVGKYYQLVVSDTKSNYYFNFKLIY